MHQLAHTFAPQVSADVYISDLFYILGALACFLVVIAISLIDGGLVSPKHLVDTFVQTMLSALFAGAALMVGGYAFWMWQYNVAFDVPNAFRQSFSDWWLLGTYMTTFAQNVDPTKAPDLEGQQIYVVYFFGYAAIYGAFIHSMGLGRLKPSASYILAAVTGGILMPILTYLAWGSCSFLTNNGMHDYVGAYSLYMFVGVWSLILTWRLGPRLTSTNSLNPHMLGSGILLLMIAIPLFVIGCGYVTPGVGYVGISGTSSGIGIVFCNIFIAFGGGAISGAVIGYRTHKPAITLLGPLAGYVACTAIFDIAAPWECFLVSLAGPWIMQVTKDLMTKLNLDDQKLVPLTLGNSTFSVLVAGIIGAGLPAGGVAGATGAYALQHAHIGFGMQCVGVVVIMLFSALTGLGLVFAIEKTIGLRVAPQIEQDGFDMWYWNEWRKSRKMRVSPKATSTYGLGSKPQGTSPVRRERTTALRRLSKRPRPHSRACDRRGQRACTKSKRFK